MVLFLYIKDKLIIYIIQLNTSSGGSGGCIDCDVDYDFKINQKKNTMIIV